MKKSDLRALYLERRRSFSSEFVKDLSRKIADNFFLIVDLSRATAIQCFIPIIKFNEIDTFPIFDRIWRNHPRIKTLVPVVNFKTSEIENCLFTQQTQLVDNKWGIREPVNCPPYDTYDLSIIIVPALCFDQARHRVGYGRGFYDRFLSHNRQCRKIGLSFFEPIKKIEDIETTDVALDLVITPDGSF